ncbi:MAG TPA: GDP-fucose synthetase [Cyanobacteria bacterium UBA11149]|nr:GDP-fucose synthetase [Cyanobacteria bacterium UBA11367]HBE56522.1 GDP-fucose synthetase [Cyanobacteria bacterium UBA11366]HBK62384.1 GDP-fucose synthetase [Cyanobacteria bacterium UBA11166]HBR75689.1 GDP-fucose synthetase [Cyanobacteria bacterium UBA11159]HBS68619.1 GDP-fucose synthetase [Cyanobacteria bacterium UBA11153]HBW91340.1 GDP-fucose synthetase [Cyanobacteria bacterium UBA11149]HCA97762.1 GDP-fucose synthetase [Cyanobacteria bacterium UBA9226]
MQKESKIYVAGHRGLVGSAIVRKLQENGYHNLILKSSDELDLRRQIDVEDFFASESPDYVFFAAAKVGGINANNTYRAEFIYENLMIESNIIHSAYLSKVKKLLFLGSSCIYPKLSPQPMKEEYLLTGFLEPTNEPYAIAKIAGIKLCENYSRQYGTNFISAMPTNLYGIYDNFDLANSHVLPALMRKTHEAKLAHAESVEIWGTGVALREFLYVDDLAEALLFLMNNYNEIEFVNVGTGEEVSIKELALLIQAVVGYQGELKFDTSKPDGTLRKLLDTSKLNGIGWRAGTSLKEGLELTYKWFLDNYNAIRGK